MNASTTKSADRTVRKPNAAAPRRRRASPDSKELLERAFDLFVEQGFEGASVDAISAAAGIAKRTLYLRYGDKEGLFRAALSHAIDNWIIPVEQLHAAETDDLGETLLTIGTLLLDNVLSPRGLSLQQLTNSVSARMPELGAHNVEAGFTPTLRFLAELIGRRLNGQVRSFANAEDAAMAFLNLVVTGPVTFVAQGVLLDRQFVDRYVEGSVRNFLHGLLPAVDTVDRPPESDGERRLFDENQRLKLMYADAMVQIDILRERVRESGRPPA